MKKSLVSALAIAVVGAGLMLSSQSFAQDPTPSTSSSDPKAMPAPAPSAKPVSHHMKHHKKHHGAKKAVEPTKEEPATDGTVAPDTSETK